MSRYAPVLRRLAALLVAAAVAVFFWRAFGRNWESIRTHQFQLAPPFLILGFLAFTATSLLATYAWHDSINTLSPIKLTFRESIATVNASSLVKYVPGKVWTYALQMYWLGKRGIARSLVLYINIINIAVSLLMAMLLGVVLLLVGPERFPHGITLAALGLLLLLDFACLRFNAPLFGWGIRVLNRLFKKDIEPFTVPSSLLLRLHALHFTATLTFAAAIYAVAFGIGYRLGFSQALPIMSSFLLSEVVGFLAFVSPGGLGVREGVMYALLGGAASGSLALVLPLAARAVSMLVDVTLGSLALKLLRQLTRSER
jgi:uncharacterized membrane protein YbhN (UPF0104 family)